jgi:catechol 2,3-dioxygenase-like lactoylglutathione lyase family enzyme
MTDIFRRIHHVCIVVHSLEETQAYYESIGIGPWLDYPPLTEYLDVKTPEPAGFSTAKYKLCSLENFQLQLCEPGPEPTPQRLFLDRKGEGVFSMGFEVRDVDYAEVVAAGAGLSVLMRGRRNDGSGFDYFDTLEKAGVTLLVRQTKRT